MFVRWRSRKLDKAKTGDTMAITYRPRKLVHWRPDEDSEYRQDVSWTAEIVTCRRVNGKPRQLHLMSFGPISESMIAVDFYRRDFWRRERRLQRWRPTPKELDRIIADLEQRVPKPGPSYEEQQARRVVEVLAELQDKV